MDDIISTGKIVALTDLSSSSYFIYKGNAMGFEYELLRRFAKHIGVRLEIQVVEDMDCVIEMLNEGEGDVIAANFTVTEDRSRLIHFTNAIFETREVLVQPLPEHWNRLSRDALNELIINDSHELIGKTVHLRRESSFYRTIQGICKAMNDTIFTNMNSNLTTETMIEMVSKGEIALTIADENVAKLNQNYYQNIDISFAISEPQPIAWGVRQNSPALLDSLNSWLHTFRTTRAYAAIHGKYFKARTQHKQRVMSEYSSLSGKSISPFDALLKRESKRMGWDWKLLAAMIKKESNFNPDIEAPSGASGLMQLIPETARHFGADSIFDPDQNVHAAVSLLLKLEKHWTPLIPDTNDRIRFILASYNVGLAHVKDACALARKYDEPETRWQNVAKYLELKSLPAYYRDPVVKYGYCRGTEPVHYVEEVLIIWNNYKEADL